MLAIAAARLGWAPVIAVDVEPRSVEATARNARRNGVEVDARLGDLLSGEVPAVATIAASVPPAVHERLAADAAGAAEADEAGARLTALNMALSGTPREETARFLAEHYALADPEGLLDDVYARAGG